jgi:hypothetical protein
MSKSIAIVVVSCLAALVGVEQTALAGQRGLARRKFPFRGISSYRYERYR